MSERRERREKEKSERQGVKKEGQCLSKQRREIFVIAFLSLGITKVIANVSGESKLEMMRREC